MNCDRLRLMGGSLISASHLAGTEEKRAPGNWHRPPGADAGREGSDLADGCDLADSMMCVTACFNATHKLDLNSKLL